MKKISFENLQGLESRNDGLSEDEVKYQTSRYGPNEIVEVAGSPWIELALDTLKDPMIWFLVGISTIFFFVGDSSEATVLFIAILPLVLMDAVLHWRTQASTSSLKSQLAAEVQVFRGSDEVRLHSTELVPGDLISITSGTFLPADGVFQEASGIQVDESTLSGEAFPVQKRSANFDPFRLSTDGEVPVDPDSLGYAGTRLLAGHGKFRVIFTGLQTSYGEIVQSVSNMPHQRTPLQKSITKLVQALIVGSGVLCLALATIRIYQGHGWLDALLSAATLAVAAIPEEFPVVFTFFLGVGVYRLAKRHALVRKAVSIENIGRVTHICTDKTGTITVGNLKLTHIDTASGETELDVLIACLGASNPEGSDPVDLAILEAAQKKNVIAPSILQTFPFTEDRKKQSSMVQLSDDQYVVYVKGSPETILSMSNLSPEDCALWLKNTAKWAGKGHKVLACARKNITQKEVNLQLEPQSGYEFSGLVAFEDPPRPEVADAISYCRKNCIKVLMITGDHPDTAIAIAKDIGLGGIEPLALSAETEQEKFQDNWLDDHPKFLLGLDIISRCTPMQKLRIVNALKRSGELVAVTGDGVNDVPALKAADIGIAMGVRGTRSAKEVSSIVLSDDNFSTITSAIMEGRQLFSNLRLSFEYLLLIHIPLVLTAALIPLFGYPLLYLPVHIVWLELIIHPTALFAFQLQAVNGVTNDMHRKSFFSRQESTRIVLLGLGLSVAVGFAFISGLNETDIGHARSCALAILTLWSGSLVFLFTQFRTRASIVIATATVLLSALLIQIPSLSIRLHLSPLHIKDWGITIVMVSAFTLLLRFLRTPPR